jgi:methionyl-tRNA formyltransferase
MSFTLFLLNKKGYEVLKALTNNTNFIKYIDCVVASKDKGNKEDFFLEIKDLCDKSNITFCDRKDDVLKIKSEYCIAVGWRWLIHEAKNLIVIHDSFLPYYRGFSPLVNMLINGEKYVAASAIWATEKMDEGNIIVQRKKFITYPCKIYDAINIVSEIYVELILDIFERLVLSKVGKLPSIPQLHNKASYSIWRDEDDYFINWKKPAEYIKRFVDAVSYPYDGAKTRIKNEDIILRIRECTILNSITSEIDAEGKLLMYDKDKPVVLCGNGAIRIDEFEKVDGANYKLKKFRTQFI